MIIEEIEDNERDSMVFNRILMEATDNLEPEMYKTIMQAFLQYGFDGETTKRDPIARGFLILAKPTIDNDNKE